MGKHPQVVEELLSNGATVGERLCGSPVGLKCCALPVHRVCSTDGFLYVAPDASVVRHH
jgi:hypothetical protein